VWQVIETDDQMVDGHNETYYLQPFLLELWPLGDFSNTRLWFPSSS
jgi:hypothetical protein